MDRGRATCYTSDIMLTIDINWIPFTLSVVAFILSIATILVVAVDMFKKHQTKKRTKKIEHQKWVDDFLAQVREQSSPSPREKRPSSIDKGVIAARKAMRAIKSRESGEPREPIEFDEPVSDRGVHLPPILQPPSLDAMRREAFAQQRQHEVYIKRLAEEIDR